jgi:hypothetical protein
VRRHRSSSSSQRIARPGDHRLGGTHDQPSSAVPRRLPSSVGHRGDDLPTSDEVRGWARLSAAVADEVLVGTVHAMHRAVTDGGFRWVGPLGRPIKAVHDAAVDGAYAAVQAGLRGAGELGALAAGRRGAEPGDDRPSPAALKARAIAHGVVDEDLLAVAPELDLDVSLRHDGREVAVDADALRRAYPGATGRIAVFVHGLVDTEEVWLPRADDDGVALPEVAAELGLTPVLVRYGTGRAIARNGADLAALLEDLVAAWPVPVTELVLVGHSMGGLVARAACVAADAEDHAWTSVLESVTYLASPHLGSWLEKVANVGSWVLRRVSPRSAPIGALLDRRSRGIKDLRFGAIVEHAWDGAAIDDLLTGMVAHLPWLDGVTHHVVVGRLHRVDGHPLNVVLGDGLVRAGSATGRGWRGRIDGAEVTVVPVAAGHTRLLRHPDVAVALREVLAPA